MKAIILRTMQQVTRFRNILLVLVLAGCGITGPSTPALEAGSEVSEVDSLRSKVTFWASSPDSIFWKLEWMNLNVLLGYGQGVNAVEVPLLYPRGLKFWLEFTAWNQSDRAVVTYMSPG